MADFKDDVSAALFGDDSHILLGRGSPVWAECPALDSYACVHGK